jgi:hypothetical protein
MAIASLDAALAGARPSIAFGKVATGTTVAGQPRSLWYLAGNPGAGAAAANTAGGVVTTSATAGALAHTNPASGEAHLMTLTAGSSGQDGTLLLCDRLIQIQGNSGGTAIDETITTSQTINSTTLPARCPTSAADDTPSTNGFGTLVGVEVAASTGAGVPTITIGYTNSGGTSGRTATNLDAATASAPVGAFYRISLQSGDVGVRSIQTYQQSATWTQGQINLVLYQVIAAVPLLAAGLPYQADPFALGLPRIYDNACLFWLWVPSTTTTGIISGLLTQTHG